MERLRPFFQTSYGRPHVDDRQVLDGIVFVNCNRLRWRNMAKYYGPPKPVLSFSEGAA